MSDTAYQTFNYRLANGGLVARDVYDRMRPGTYQNLNNIESRSENSLSSRYGIKALSTDGVNNFPLATPAQSLGRMKGLSNPYNYAAAGTTLYRKATDSAGVYTAISSAISGDRLSMYPYRPDATSAPYMFFADDDVLLKDSGTGNAVPWGILPPTIPCLIGFGDPSQINIELFDEANTSSFTLTNLTSAAMNGRVSAEIDQAVTAPGLKLIQPSPAGAASLTRTTGVSTFTSLLNHNFVSGMRVQIFGALDTTYNVGSVVIVVTGPTTFTYSNPGADGSTTNASASPMPSFQVGMSITTSDNVETVYITEVFDTGFVANFANTHANPFIVTGSYLFGMIAAATIASISKTGTFNISFPVSNPPTNNQEAPENNLIQLFIYASNPLAIAEIKLMFDVGDGSFTRDYYWKSIAMHPAQAAASGYVTTGATQTGAVFQRAGGYLDVRGLGDESPSLLPTDLPILQKLQPRTLNAGMDPWSLVQARIGEFATAGQAGSPTNDWTKVVAWKVQIRTNPNATVSVGIDNLLFIGGADLDSFAGQPYDYRSTYYNINTGCESSPSVIMIGDSQGTQVGQFPPATVAPIPLSVQNQPIVVQPAQPTDPQVTHIRIYRRGGTLTQGWYFVDQIPVGTLLYLDRVADSVILNNNLLNIDADAPVTTLLPTPMDTVLQTWLPVGLSLGPGLVTAQYPAGQTFYPGQLVTIDTGQNQETVYIISLSSASRLQFYAQFYHGHGFPLSIKATATTRPQTPMNLMAIAFDKAWLAGDPNNPHVLYYSTTFKPETFPVENSLEVGTPDAPIMALIEMNGLLYVFTTKRVYQVLGAGSAIPTIIPTGCKHGLAAKFAWCISENAIFYLSYDGIYVFSGGASGYLSEPVEWVWTNRIIGPVSVLSPAFVSNVSMAYANHEVFVAYQDAGGVARRLIFHDVYHRWRNDESLVGSVTGITAQYFAEDIGIFTIGKSDSMVYQDRIGDYDSGGFVGGVEIKNPIAINFQTAQMDQSEASADNAKRYKLYNELTIDADLNGQTLFMNLMLNGGATVIPLGTIIGSAGAGRQQFQINLNNGEGYEALNVGLLLTGFAAAKITLFELHVRAAVQAEARRSWDTWWLGQGDDEWKVTKQIFAEYKAVDPAGITVNAFLDGDMSAPKFTFTLPQSAGSHRIANKVRFPATKYRLLRLVGTSNSDFFMYDDTQIEQKLLGTGKGYQRSKISP